MESLDLLVAELKAPEALRLLNEKDAEAVLDLYKTYRINTYSLEKIEFILQSSPAFGLFDKKGKIHAYVYTELFAPDIIQIGNIFVASEYRNKGLGTILIAIIERQVQSLGFKSVIVSNSLLYETKELKKAATGFYKKCGYSLIFETDMTKVFIKSLFK